MLALVAFGVLFWLYRTRPRRGGGARYAEDVVCGMQVEKEPASATVTHAGQRYYFCSGKWREQFTAEPARYARTRAAPG